MPKQRFESTAPSSTTTTTRTENLSISAAAEPTVRQLIASGDHKSALELAKQIHKASRNSATEALLVDAYIERIRALRRRNLTVEAQSLMELVRQRYPSARNRLKGLVDDVARTATLDDLVRPLNDSELEANGRLAIERTLERELVELGTLAQCDALPQDHPLRHAAAALNDAFVAVTTGPVSDDRLALPEVSRRSPLAPWKQLVRAIASFYRDDKESCERYLCTISPESAPARLVPVLRAMLNGDVGLATSTPLTPAAATLKGEVTNRSCGLSRELEALDQTFKAGNKSRIFSGIRSAVATCRQSAPELLETLRQHISVRCAVIDLDPKKVRTAMGGPSRHDAAFIQLFARAMEEAGDPEKIVGACRLWEEFRHAAAKEGWFAVNGREAAALSLHIAELLQRLPEPALRELQRERRARALSTGENVSFLFPEELYQRACALDPHPEAFSRWMAWATRESSWQVQQVAATWHKVRPQDIDPILRLLDAAEKRDDYRSALGYLANIERIDGLYPNARGIRLRLLARSALRHVQKKKFRAADEDLTAMAAVVGTQDQDWAALLTTLRFVSNTAAGKTDASRDHADLEQYLGRPASALLVSAVAAAAKQRLIVPPATLDGLMKQERASLPTGVARVARLTRDLKVKLEIPGPMVSALSRQLAVMRGTLDVDQLRILAEWAISAKHLNLAYSFTSAGLHRGGTTEARFLLLRAQALREWLERRMMCAKAAAALASEQQDSALIEEAFEVCRGIFVLDENPLPLDQAREVLQREKAALKAPTRNRPGPDYGYLLSTCQCPDCRRARGATVGPFDDLDEDFEDFDDAEELSVLDMPPGIAEIFERELQKAMMRGESPESFMARLLQKKGRRRQRKGRRR